MNLFVKILIATVVIGGTLYGMFGADRKTGSPNCSGSGYTKVCD